MTQTISLEIRNGIALIGIANPPVNALSQAVRAGLQDAIEQVSRDMQIKSAVLYGTGRTFIAGADIREFGKPAKEPFLPNLINEIEACEKPVIAALHGTVLGGGLEVALGAHYRIAAAHTKLGLPEVTLGLLPGAGGTQRLPRIVPVEVAIDMITSGKPIDAKQALDLGLIDHLTFDGDIAAAGYAFALEILQDGAGVRRTGEMPCNRFEADGFDQVRSKLKEASRGQIAPHKCVDAIQGAVELPFEKGLEQERALFRDLMVSDQRAALIHAFFAERQVGKLPELKGVEPRTISTIGVVGGGTMGVGIAVAALLSGLTVKLVERDREAVDKAAAAVSKTLAGSVKRGKLSQQEHDEILSSRFKASSNYDDLSDVDVVIEAVFESIDVKRDVFARLDAVCKPQAILATNTSYLNVDDIADMTGRPRDVLGLHFFSPAHVMKLLEVVVGKQTSLDVIATGFALAKRLKKIAVRAGVCDGFIGNRILAHYRKAIDGVVLAGASPFDVDRALVNFGLAMGPFAVGDLAGLDIGWANRKRLASSRDPRETYAEFADRLCEAGHFGRKSGKGFYIYQESDVVPNADVLQIIASERVQKGLQAKPISDEEVVDRYMAAMVNEAARVVEEGIALRPLDVDVTLINGYGFPRWRGGPMHYADTVGLDKVLNDIKRLSVEDDFFWQPAPLLTQLVAEGKTFASLNSRDQ